MSNAPMLNSTSSSFLQTWIDALTKPREATYASIGDSPSAKATTAYVWVFLSSIVASIVTLLVQGSSIRQQLENSGVGLDQLGGSAGSIAVTLLCGAPIAAIFGTLVFAVWTAVVQWIAKMFGGTGTNDRLAYVLAAISAPYSIVSAALVLLSAIPFVGLCFSVITGLGGLYVLVLQVMGIKSVNRFGWGPAIASYAIPGLAILLVCCAFTAVILTISGAALGTVFSSINQSLIP